MNIQLQSWLMNRRHFLRGAGVCLALPFLECMRPLRAAAAEKERVRRNVFIYLPNGVNTRDFQMPTAGSEYELSKPLQALSGHRNVITPLSGLHHPNGLGQHHNCRKIWLTGGRLGPADRNTISVDQQIAQVTAPKTRFASLELSNQGASLAWNSDGIQLPSHAGPALAFREMFEDPKGGVAAQRRGLERRGSILDTVLGEANALKRELAGEDRGRLDQYLTSVREVELRTQRSHAWLESPRPKVGEAMQSRLTRDISLQLLGDYLRTTYDLIVLAFQTDMTRVVTFNTGEEGQGPAVPEIGVKQDRHSLSHHNGNEDLLRQLTESDTFNFTQFGYFLSKLHDVSDADGPLIDSTVSLYGSGMAYGHSHGNASLPLVLAGGAALGIRHGRHLDFNLTKDFQGYATHPGIYHKPVNEKVRLSNLLLTLAQKAGVETDRFADSTGELSEILA